MPEVESAGFQADVSGNSSFRSKSDQLKSGGDHVSVGSSVEIDSSEGLEEEKIMNTAVDPSF